LKAAEYWSVKEEVRPNNANGTTLDKFMFCINPRKMGRLLKNPFGGIIKNLSYTTSDVVGLIKNLTNVSGEVKISEELYRFGDNTFPLPSIIPDLNKDPKISSFTQFCCSCEAYSFNSFSCLSIVFSISLIF
jgi:hypothetical protein